MFSIFVLCGPKVKITKDMTALQRFEAAKKLIKYHKYYQAQTELDKLRYQLMGTEYIDQILFYLGEAYRLNKDYPEALVNYQNLVRDYPNSSYSARAQYYIGLCYKEMSLKPELDQEYTQKAISSFKDLIELFPQNEYQDSAKIQINLLQNKLAEKSFKNGKFYFKIEKYNSAEIYFKDIILNYYNSEWIDDAFFYLALTYLKENKKEDAKALFQRIISEYKNSKYINEAKKYLKLLSEKK